MPIDEQKVWEAFESKDYKQRIRELEVPDCISVTYHSDKTPTLNSIKSFIRLEQKRTGYRYHQRNEPDLSLMLVWRVK